MRGKHGGIYTRVPPSPLGRLLNNKRSASMFCRKRGEKASIFNSKKKNTVWPANAIGEPRAGGMTRGSNSDDQRMQPGLSGCWNKRTPPKSKKCRVVGYHLSESHRRQGGHFAGRASRATSRSPPHRRLGSPGCNLDAAAENSMKQSSVIPLVVLPI